MAGAYEVLAREQQQREKLFGKGRVIASNYKLDWKG